jgi:hypothetical protein
MPCNITAELISNPRKIPFSEDEFNPGHITRPPVKRKPEILEETG